MNYIENVASVLEMVEPVNGVIKISAEVRDLLVKLLKEQRETIASLALNKENAEQAKESAKPTVDEFGDAHCICGETVGHIPQNDKTLPKICLNYCYSCGRKLVWE